MSKRKYKADILFKDSNDKSWGGHPAWCVKDPRGKKVAFMSGPKAKNHAEQIAKALTGTR